MSAIPKKQKNFLLLIYTITVMFLAHSIIFGYIKVDFQYNFNVLFFSILVALAESFTVPFKKMSFSLSFSLALISYILLGSFTGIIILAFGYLLRIVRIGERQYIHVFNTPIYGTIFNCCALILPMMIGNYVYIFLGGSFNEVSIYGNTIPILAFSAVYLIVNIAIISALLSVRTGKNILICFCGNIGMGILSMLLTLPISIIAVIMFEKYSYLGIVLVVFFLSLLRYTLILYSNSKEQFAETVTALMNAVEARDQYTNGHSKRVAAISTKIARKMGLSIWEIEKINVAAMLHDVGKIGISDTILQKPGKLTEEEFAIIKSHPEIGINIIKDIKNIEYVFPIVRHHHERYDGKGYPDKKGGDELSLSVYIVQLADSVDAMASNRPYRNGLSSEMIIKEIEKGMGTQFHPKVASTYLKILKERE